MGDRVGVEDSELTIENDTVGVAVIILLLEWVVDGQPDIDWLTLDEGETDDTRDGVGVTEMLLETVIVRLVVTLTVGVLEKEDVTLTELDNVAFKLVGIGEKLKVSDTDTDVEPE